MKFILAAAALAVAQASSPSEIRSLRSTSNPYNNDQICYQILETTWWKARKSSDINVSISKMDETCKVFKGQENEEACNSQAARKTLFETMGQQQWNNMFYGGSASTATIQEGLQAACTMVGAHNGGCIGNPCNSLNDGSCQVSSTQGQCVWYTDSDVKTINAYRNADPSNRWGGKIPGHGCYRNPCNIPGTGKQDASTCQPYAVPSLFQCTYCKGGPQDKKLQGQGMGCQMTRLESWNINMCAYVKTDANVPPGSIWRRKANPSCECSDRFRECEYLVSTSDERGLFEKKQK